MVEEGCKGPRVVGLGFGGLRRTLGLQAKALHEKSNIYVHICIYIYVYTL